MRVLGSTRSIPALQYVATTFNTTGFGVWKWQQDAVGWGTRYSLPTFLVGDGAQAEFSPDNNYIVVSYTNSSLQGQVRMYPFSFNGIGTQVSGGFVTSPDAPALGVAWHPDQNAILFGLGYQDAPTMRAIKWTGTAWGTTYSQPASDPTSNVYSTAFSFDGDYAFSADSDSPYIFAYPWTQASGFGTKKANPTTLPTDAVISIDTQEEQVVLALEASPYVSAYPFISSWGTKYADPATLPTGLGLDVSFSGTGHVAVAHQTSPYVTAYPFGGSGFGTKYANPSTAIPGNAGGIDFSPDQKNIVVGTGGDSPFMQMYSWSSGWGTKYSDPAVLPSNGNGVTRFSNL
jgi:WD40 repeat protein